MIHSWFSARGDGADVTPEQIKQQTTVGRDEYQTQTFNARPKLHQTEETPATSTTDNEQPASEQPRRRRSKPKKEPTVALYLKVPADVARNLRLKACAEESSQSEIAAEALRVHCGEWARPYQRSA